MYGAGLARLGSDMGMKPMDDRLCGAVQGFPLMLREVAGYKLLTINLGAAGDGALPVLDALTGEWKAQYRVTKHALEGTCLTLSFHDAFGTIGRLRAFLQAELPRLGAAGFAGAARCPHCDKPLQGDDAQLRVLGGMPYALHVDCADDFARQHAEKSPRTRKGDGKALSLAWLGALLGGVAGCIPWVLVGILGRAIPMLAVFIPFGIQYGHRLLGGRPGRARLALVVILSLVLVPLAGIAAGGMIPASAAELWVAYIFVLIAFIFIWRMQQNEK